MRLKSGKAVFTDIGREKCCPRCSEYWPADSQFYHTNPSKTDGLQYWCKACYAEWQTAKKLKNKEGSLCIH